MTVLLLSLAAALSLLLAGFQVKLAHASAVKGRAQIAADAAALAAVAEAAPYGRGVPLFEARRFAELNGARLLTCLCDDGASAAQVTVALGDVVAVARAVFDPTMLAPASTGGYMGLHPLVADAVDALIRASQGRVRLLSGYRSAAEQTVLWTEAVRRYGSTEKADDWVARPGESMHERGLAVDLGGDVALAVRLVAQLGLPLHRPLAHEPWHFELVAR